MSCDADLHNCATKGIGKVYMYFFLALIIMLSIAVRLSFHRKEFSILTLSKGKWDLAK